MKHWQLKSSNFKRHPSWQSSLTSGPSQGHLFMSHQQV